MGAACGSDRATESEYLEELAHRLFVGIRRKQFDECKLTIQQIKAKTRGVSVPSSLGSLLEQSSLTSLLSELNEKDITELDHVLCLDENAWYDLKIGSRHKRGMGRLESYIELVGLKMNLNRALIEATKDDFCSVVELLLVSKADVSYTDETTHKTPLMWACMQGSVESVKLLVLAKADILKEDKLGHTCLSLSKQLGQDRIVRMLNNRLNGNDFDFDPNAHANQHRTDEKNGASHVDYASGHVDNASGHVDDFDQGGYDGGSDNKHTNCHKSHPETLTDLLQQAKLSPEVGRMLMEEGYDEIDWYITANERDWQRMMKATGVTNQQRKRIQNCFR
mmetsp:Transcript_31117/g.54673  ORF Transcript_31117/g.54673 Transcript_31117/m.54673 type:complete len:336 (+) Transcript_31117:154-1161(+)|eukprot:CAMPEP_0197536634 /NCGR_PEP_ID=MMETSP1318-20131121/54422_1 /TAXON_ID=552666 /ORGANISM="Partenskyella glossopodia, Strain RCC365" /LENGTH=335 /DNA_ID=CAMNT_0043094573 /DNA_START=85 /DNA_END=1092 /DNA_ORIENTATION=+